jgi:hypothetical protein
MRESRPPEDADALRDRWMRAQQPHGAAGVGEAGECVAIDPERDPQGGDACGGERLAEVRRVGHRAAAARQDRDAANGHAVGQMEDRLDLGPRDGERDALEH